MARTASGSKGVGDYASGSVSSAGIDGGTGVGRMVGGAATMNTSVTLTLPGNVKIDI
jgi:hypothetical protein